MHTAQAARQAGSVSIQDRIHAPALEVHSPNQWTSMQFMASSLLDSSLFQVHACILILLLLLLFSILGTQKTTQCFCAGNWVSEVQLMENDRDGVGTQSDSRAELHEFAWVLVTDASSERAIVKAQYNSLIISPPTWP